MKLNYATFVYTATIQATAKLCCAFSSEGKETESSRVYKFCISIVGKERGWKVLEALEKYQSFQ